jgi:hypothetical protein
MANLLMFTYFIMPPVSLYMFQTFVCVDLDPYHELAESQFFLSQDLSVSCSTSYYKYGKSWATIMVFVYPIGIPLGYLLILYCNRHLIVAREFVSRIANAQLVTRSSRRQIVKDSSRMIDSASFIYASYKPAMWYWEIIEVYKRLFLVAIFPSTLNGNVAQFPVTVLFCLFAVKLYQGFAPFASTSDAVLAEVGQYQVFLVYFAGYIIYFKSFDNHAFFYEVQDYVLVAANMVDLLLSLYFAFNDYKELATVKSTCMRIVKKVVPLLELNIVGSAVHRRLMNGILCNQPDDGVEIMLRLVFKRLTSRRSRYLDNTCFYYYPMTPLPREFIMLTYNTVEAYSRRFNSFFYRVDTVDIDRVTFVCHYTNSHGKSKSIAIPESAFGRYLYRSNHDRIVGCKKEVSASTDMLTPVHFRRLCIALALRSKPTVNDSKHQVNADYSREKVLEFENLIVNNSSGWNTEYL